MQYALIKNGVVANVIVADLDFIAQIEADWDRIEALDTLHEQGLGVSIGWTWDGEFHAPHPALPTTVFAPRHISVGSFLDRFGAQKWPILADTNPMVQALVKDCSVRQFINLDDAQLGGGLAMLVGAGHDIDPAAILSAPVQDRERA